MLLASVMLDKSEPTEPSCAIYQRLRSIFLEYDQSANQDNQITFSPKKTIRLQTCGITFSKVSSSGSSSNCLIDSVILDFSLHVFNGKYII